MTNNKFLTSIERRFFSMSHYEDRNLRSKALNLIPVLLLEQRAQVRFRELQRQIKKGLADDVNISIQEMLLLELLDWFKNDFFEWVDSPECDYCFSETKFSHMSADPKLLVNTNKVEMHRCLTCDRYTPFSRYVDLAILLGTREGRCGEWAAVFTLLCMAFGWDARLVCDETDHVWTEVYSIAKTRWLHCDPCENTCDNPLMYEVGWQKQLSYVMAYTCCDIQDVSWRYSADHAQLLRNRTKCTELELIATMLRLRETKQRLMTPSKRNYLTRRTLHELVELLVEKKPIDTDSLQGRTSGALSWRLGRGETNVEPNSKIWTPTTFDSLADQMIICYSPITDRYERISADGTITEIVRKWENGVFHVRDVFRKEEKDWKAVYLCRKETASDSEIQWQFETGNSGKTIDKVNVKFNSQVFENGQIHVEMYGNDKRIVDISNCPAIYNSSSGEFSGATSLKIKAVLSGGRGACAWQHAQLFRQAVTTNTERDDYPFMVHITFK